MTRLLEHWEQPLALNSLQRASQSSDWKIRADHSCRSYHVQILMAVKRRQTYSLQAQNRHAEKANKNESVEGRVP